MSRSSTPSLTSETNDLPSIWAPLRHGWFWGILALAILCRLLWSEVSQNFIGADAVRYLWISQHVQRGSWELVPQLYTSPLLPTLTGLLARLTEDELLSGRIIGILSNILALSLAMLWLYRLFPARPVLAWLTGVGLAVNHVWCRLAPFVLTDNLFYCGLMALLLLMTLLWERATWGRAIAFGFFWAMLFFSREIGLYAGGIIFLVLLSLPLAQRGWAGVGPQNLKPMVAGSLFILTLLLTLWAFWYQHSLGIFSLGAGSRFYTNYSQTFQREGRHPHYQNGTLSFFQLRPYEVMEYTRFPSPSDPRFPPSTIARFWQHPRQTLALWTNKEFQRVTVVGWLTLLILPLLLWRGLLTLPAPVYGSFFASLGVLALHFLGPVREARLVGWFFPGFI